MSQCIILQLYIDRDICHPEFVILQSIGATYTSNQLYEFWKGLSALRAGIGKVELQPTQARTIRGYLLQASWRVPGRRTQQTRLVSRRPTDQIEAINRLPRDNVPGKIQIRVTNSQTQVLVEI